jgi:aquaporin Z
MASDTATEASLGIEMEPRPEDINVSMPRYDAPSLLRPTAGMNIKERSYWWAPLTTEFLGSFSLVFTVAMNVGFATTSITVSAGSATWDPIAIGSILMVLVFMGGHVSGAHYNPAVTLGVFLRGKISKGLAFWYVIFQLLGSFGGGLLCYLATGYHPYPKPGQGYTQGEVFVCEMTYTCALVLVVLNVATTKAQEKNSYFGLAIGFTVTAGAYSVGPISGAVFNPAVGTGLLLTHMFAGGSFADIWVYWFAPSIGAIFAALFFRLMNPKEFEAQELVAS